MFHKQKFFSLKNINPTKKKKKNVQHDHLVTGLDWCAATNQILSCSQDRNAYVWTFLPEKNEWKPSLVLLRIAKAATCCKWAPNGQKFAVGSAAKEISVCYYEKDNNWWVAKMIKTGIESTVLGVTWCPTDQTILGYCGTDNKVHCVEAYIKGPDEKKLRKDKKYGEIIQAKVAKGWVRSLEFSPDGKICAYTSHDSRLTLFEVETGKIVTELRHSSLPFRTIKFLSNNAIVCGGFDNYPVVFCTKGDNNWVSLGNIDVTASKKSDESSSATRTAFKRFQQSPTSPTSGDSKQTILTKSRHHRDIVDIEAYTIENGNVTVFTTSSLDGTILFWKASEIQFEGKPLFEALA